MHECLSHRQIHDEDDNFTIPSPHVPSNAEINHAHHARYVHSAHIRIIRVMCSGRVEPAFILEALKDGADGVLITSCHIGDCHYIDGNRNAEIRINNTDEALKYLGPDGRLRLEWVSASKGARFAEVVKEFTEDIRKLGPSPLKET